LGTLTRQAAEGKLVARVGPWMGLVGMFVAATGGGGWGGWGHQAPPSSTGNMAIR
jgi:hypothetical protein